MRFLTACVLLFVPMQTEAKFTFLPAPTKYSFISEETEIKSSEGYPIRGSWWTVNGGYPDKGSMIRHLQEGQHRSKFDVSWLSSLSRQELHSLHSDDHEGKITEQARPFQIIVVSPAWCPACRVWKQKEQPKFVEYNWTFGANKHVNVVSDHPQASAYPTFLIMRDGKVYKKFTGYTKAETLMSIYNKMVKEN